MSEHHEGGCLCGALRYAIRGEIIDAGYCHCRRCQRASGAPVTAWLSLARRDFAFLRGTPTTHRAATGASRQFCPTCGTSMTFFSSDDADEIDITIVSLHRPGVVRPQYHIWCASRLAWLDIADGLARHDDAGPDRMN